MSGGLITTIVTCLRRRLIVELIATNVRTGDLRLCSLSIIHIRTDCRLLCYGEQEIHLQQKITITETGSIFGVLWENRTRKSSQHLKI